MCWRARTTQEGGDFSVPQVDYRPTFLLRSLLPFCVLFFKRSFLRVFFENTTLSQKSYSLYPTACYTQNTALYSHPGYA